MNRIGYFHLIPFLNKMRLPNINLFLLFYDKNPSPSVKYGDAIICYTVP